MTRSPPRSRLTAIGVPVIELPPIEADADDRTVSRQWAKKVFDELLGCDDRAVLLVLTQVLDCLAKATNR